MGFIEGFGKATSAIIELNASQFFSSPTLLKKSVVRCALNP